MKTWLKNNYLDILGAVGSLAISVVAYRDFASASIVAIWPWVLALMKRPAIGVGAFFLAGAIEGGIAAWRGDLDIPWGWLILAVCVQVLPWWLWQSSGKPWWALPFLWLWWLLPGTSDFAWPSPILWGSALAIGPLGLLTAVTNGMIVQMAARTKLWWTPLPVTIGAMAIAVGNGASMREPAIAYASESRLVFAHPLEYSQRETHRARILDLIDMPGDVILPENYWVVDETQEEEAWQRFARWRDRDRRLWMGVMVRIGKSIEQQVWMAGRGAAERMRPAITFPMFKGRSGKDPIGKGAMMGEAWILVCYEAAVPWRYIGASRAQWIGWIASTWMLPEATDRRQRVKAALLSMGVARRPLLLANWY